MKNKHKAELEIERKYFFEDEEELKRILMDQGFCQLDEEKEGDVYFSGADGAYIRDRTCLRFRVREGDDHFTIDYKGKSESLTGGFAKRETNMPQPLANLETMEELFLHLGFYRYVEVTKQRLIFQKRSDGFTENVAFDRLDSVGNFLEIEIIAPTSYGNILGLQDVLLRQEQVLAGCGLQRADVPYRDFVAWHHRKMLSLSNSKIVVDLDSVFDLSKEKIGGASLNEATGDALTSANLRALRLINATGNLGILTRIGGEQIRPWLAKAGLVSDNLAVTCHEDAILMFPPRETILIKSGTTPFSLQDFSTIPLGQGQYKHLMQAYMLLSYATPCEINRPGVSSRRRISPQPM